MHLILIDNSTEKLSQLPKDIYATHIIDSSALSEESPDDGIVAKLMEITDGQGVDYVIDAVGHPEVLKIGQQALAKCGTLLTLGGKPTEAGIRIDLQLIKGITYRGTHQGDSVPSVVSIPLSALPLATIPISLTLVFWCVERKYSCIYISLKRLREY